MCHLKERFTSTYISTIIINNKSRSCTIHITFNISIYLYSHRWGHLGGFNLNVRAASSTEFGVGISRFRASSYLRIELSWFGHSTTNKHLTGFTPVFSHVPVISDEVGCYGPLINRWVIADHTGKRKLTFDRITIWYYVRSTFINFGHFVRLLQCSYRGKSCDRLVINTGNLIKHQLHFIYWRIVLVHILKKQVELLLRILILIYVRI